ncbi:MAG: MBL fold metallo-hydrolase [Leptolyngbyaceae bacterium]|nr:MBL fold metallo-hydrolase [Leptolyngbyaceae bacterium]
MQINVFKSPEPAFLVNSFIIETQNGIIVIDTQFLVSEARKLKQEVEKLSKPLLGVIVTHPHPDHFNGVGILCENLEVPIYATQSTLDAIIDIEAGKREFWKQTYGDDYPDSTTLPNQIVRSKEDLVIDDVSLVIDDLGAGESSDITVIYVPSEKALIASDLLYNKVHPWLAEGRSKAWVKQIEYVKSTYVETEIVYAGHGSEGNLDVLDGQIEYIQFFQELVSNYLQADEELDDTAKAKIKQTMQTQYSGYPLEFLIEMNADGVAKELAS